MSRLSVTTSVLVVVMLVAVVWRQTPGDAAGNQPLRIIRVLDGDTVDVVVNGKYDRVRLAGCIDAPERSQAYGDDATAVLSNLLSSASSISDHGRDRYGRLLGRIINAHGDVSVQLVSSGAAWVYHHGTDCVSSWLQDSARVRGAGLWGAKTPPTPPWEHRKSRP